MKEAIKNLKKAVEEQDNEKAHAIYDEILEFGLAEYNPKLVNKIRRITKGIAFWYA